ncbi:MAG: GNAT family N-acetyltransferase [Clostridium sp.]
MDIKESINNKRIYFKVAKLNELSQEEVYDMCKARYEVFVCEQKITSENDFDDKDKECLHLLAIEVDGEENRRIVGYCRLLPAGMSYDEASIGRVLVMKELRGSGIAQEMMKIAINQIKESFCENKITLSAQSYIKGLYLSVGFKQVSDEYDEAGIPHVKMKYKGE